MIKRSYGSYYHTMPDGTVKQINPFSGAEVWSVPGRGSKPITNEVPRSAQRLAADAPIPNCLFCPGHQFETSPEKSRMVPVNGRPEILYYLPPDQYGDGVADFRRVGNLFEIVTLDYWRRNYQYRLPRSVELWRDDYLSSAIGAQHVDRLLRFKLGQSGKTEEQIAALPDAERLRMAEALFGGCHDLIIGRQHFAPHAEFDSQLCSSGELTPDEHYQYFRFTIDAMRDMLEMNRYIRYISVFQNWQRPAGASVDHLHKQICALDDWGASIAGQIDTVRQDPNVFNELGANLAAQYNLVFAQNDHAVAFVGIGHRFPTIEIYSRSRAPRPYQHAEEELRGFSDLVHACHAALGNQLPCNEEWFYTPVDAVYNMPWHVELKWRVNVPAGFEGGTGIYINPVMPADFRDKIVPRLYDLRDHGVIANISIAEGCTITPNPLQYYLFR